MNQLHDLNHLWVTCYSGWRRPRIEFFSRLRCRMRNECVNDITASNVAKVSDRAKEWRTHLNPIAIKNYLPSGHSNSIVFSVSKNSTCNGISTADSHEAASQFWVGSEGSLPVSLGSFSPIIRYPIDNKLGFCSSLVLRDASARLVRGAPSSMATRPKRNTSGLRVNNVALKCDDFTLVVLWWTAPSQHSSSTVGGDNEFLVRSIKDNYGAGAYLSLCRVSTRDQNKKEAYYVLQSGDASIGSIDMRCRVITCQGGTLLQSQDGVKWERIVERLRSRFLSSELTYFIT